MATATTLMQTSSTKTESPAQKPQRHTVRNVLVLLTFALTCYQFGSHRVNDAAISTPPHDYGALPNFHAVHTYLYRGGQPTARGLGQLKQMGVTTVIDLRRNKQNIALERIEAEQLGLKYISLPMGNFVPAANKQAQFFSVVNAAAADPRVGPVFLHCSHGSDRTGFMVALWRFQHDGWTVGEALTEMLTSGFIVHKFRKDDAKTPLFD